MMVFESEELSPEQTAEALVSWNVTAFKTTEIEIQLDFKEPILISSSQIKDTLKLYIDKPFFFVSKEGEMLKNVDWLQV